MLCAELPFQFAHCCLDIALSVCLLGTIDYNCPLRGCVLCEAELVEHEKDQRADQLYNCRHQSREDSCQAHMHQITHQIQDQVRHADCQKLREHKLTDPAAVDPESVVQFSKGIIYKGIKHYGNRKPLYPKR